MGPRPPSGCARSQLPPEPRRERATSFHSPGTSAAAGPSHRGSPGALCPPGLQIFLLAAAASPGELTARMGAGLFFSGSWGPVGPPDPRPAPLEAVTHRTDPPVKSWASVHTENSVLGPKPNCRGVISLFTGRAASRASRSGRWRGIRQRVDMYSMELVNETRYKVGVLRVPQRGRGRPHGAQRLTFSLWLEIGSPGRLQRGVTGAGGRRGGASGLSAGWLPPRAASDLPAGLLARIV